MRQLYLLLLALVIMTVTFSGCITEDNSGEIADLKEELQAEIDALKALLEESNSISQVLVEDNVLKLIFANGEVLTTILPESEIPQIGDNGNWWIGAVDLGVPAQSEIPIIGANGNWWIGGEDTGVSFAVTDGQNGKDGVDGANGSDGKDGVDGTNGKDGVNGLTPYIGENGNWWIGTEDTGIKAEGQDGTNGSDGKDGVDGTNGTDGKDGVDGTNGTNGSDGVDGNTPFVGANGNWWIGTDDTGIKAEGQDGVDGTNGLDGADGIGISSVEYDQTSGTLTITLDDATVYSFVLSYEDTLKAVKLNDLNGEYMVSAIYNGDLPFVMFDYTVDNRLETVTYYTTVLNQPVKYLSIDRKYTVGGDIESQSYTEWATKKKAIQEGEIWPEKELGINMTPEDAFFELTGSVDETLSDEFYLSLTGNAVYKDSLIYVMGLDDNGETIVRKFMVRETDATEPFGMIEVGPEGVYVWTTPYDEENEEWSGSYETTNSAYNYRSIYYDGSTYVLGASETITYYPWGQQVLAITDPIDDTSVAGKVDDYVGIYSGDYENPDNALSGDFKTLFKTYSTYEPGDQIDNYSLVYAYEGENFRGYDDGEGEDVFYVTVDNGKIVTVALFDEGEKEDMLGFNYTDNKLTSIDYIYEAIDDIVMVSYDGQGNPIEFSVNPSLLEEQSVEGNIDNELLASLGLIYSYDEYDPTLGMVVEKYHYPDAYTPLINITYNYDMKSFMNHTFMAANPLTSFFDVSNAISEIGWAGHGSATFNEYLNFNEGGYPEEIKTYLQVSASDVPLEATDELEDFGIPINGSVAVKYKLEYVKKNP
ncbi:hypothetical protein [Reichenbachiella sp. MSK19-1]|uniref:hypothetical protein n=1 Tax=Reichenbachiella sp. MSK19-1 TaxID=1897631 RepID=UPI001C877867|nr:hypothetical protein [Reichenbachiella sp. MSK19-1]